MHFGPIIPVGQETKLRISEGDRSFTHSRDPEVQHQKTLLRAEKYRLAHPDRLQKTREQYTEKRRLANMTNSDIHMTCDGSGEEQYYESQGKRFLLCETKRIHRHCLCLEPIPVDAAMCQICKEEQCKISSRQSQSSQQQPLRQLSLIS